jgi:hypothetical protein
MAELPTKEEMEQMQRKAEEGFAKRSEEEFWKAACLSALTGINMGLASGDVVTKAVGAADEALTAFKRRFRKSEDGKLVSLPGGRSNDLSDAR